MSSEEPQAAGLAAELDRRYRQADRLAKEVENFRDEAVIPALNELRNAGRHLIDCIRPDGTIKNDGQYRAALAHCDRAAYEAAEAGILTCARIVRTYRQTFSNVAISTIVTQFPKIQADVQTALRDLEIGRDPDTDPATRCSPFSPTICPGNIEGRERIMSNEALRKQSTGAPTPVRTEIEGGGGGETARSGSALGTSPSSAPFVSKGSLKVANSPIAMMNMRFTMSDLEDIAPDGR